VVDLLWFEDITTAGVLVRRAEPLAAAESCQHVLHPYFCVAIAKT